MSVFISLVQLVTSVALVSAPCPTVKQETSCYWQQTIYIASAHQGDLDTLMHEYGHAWDDLRLTDTDRQRFQRTMGYPASIDWLQETRYRLSPSEEFANAYAECALGRADRRLRFCKLLPRSAYAVWLTRL